jgi:hypothetical protein
LYLQITLKALDELEPSEHPDSTQINVKKRPINIKQLIAWWSFATLLTQTKSTAAELK